MLWHILYVQAQRELVQLWKNKTKQQIKVATRLLTKVTVTQDCNKLAKLRVQGCHKVDTRLSTKVTITQDCNKLVMLKGQGRHKIVWTNYKVVTRMLT